ncbi:exonuclease domain-containing protein [Corynebacterium jeikeium]|uniref:exonuclease domain-containing protein n=1 Tax=Corynebacterium jeikeium TaxID=38289 RepID=UPI00068CDD2A|nr:exonuclease domain-containing protein [Corynebacterium jeikeium]
MVTSTQPQFAVVDVETTGFGKHDRIVEVAVVHVDATGSITKSWSTLINPNRDIPNAWVHGIKAADVANAPTFEEIASALAHELDGRIFVAHNAAFDARMVRQEFERAGIRGLNLIDNYLCTMLITGRVYRSSGRSLESALACAGLSNDWPHSALGDAMATAALLGHYIATRNVRLNGVQPVEALRALGASLPVAAPVPRGEGITKPGAWVRDLASGVPFKGFPNVDSYLELLERAMLDRVLTTSEINQLKESARELGIGQEEAREIHVNFVRQLGLLAWADGVVTDDERRELESVAESLAVEQDVVREVLQGPLAPKPPTPPKSPQPSESSAPKQTVESSDSPQTPLADQPDTWLGNFALKAGDRVTFTGAMELPRATWETRAQEAGLTVGGVTKKSKLLVAADPESRSGKARKAIEVGVPIVNEATFARLLGEMEAADHATSVQVDAVSSLQANLYEDGGEGASFYEEPEDSTYSDDDAPAAVVLAEFFAQADAREQLVLQERFAAVKPRTLDQLGQKLGLTRERVRQIEKGVLKRLRKQAKEGPIAELIEAIRAQAYPVGTLQQIVDSHPELDEQVEWWGAPLWLILDRLDDSFLVEKGWVCFPDLKTAAARTAELLQRHTNEEGVARLGELETELEPALLTEWLRQCGYQVLQGHVLTRVGSLPARAAGILSIRGVPMSVGEIFKAVGQGRTERSFRNALAATDELMRTSTEEWALRRWGLEEYTSLKGAIGVRVQRAVDAGEPGVPLADLLAELPGKFGVAESSVRLYSSEGDFELADGLVIPRVSENVNNGTPEESDRMYLCDGRWQLLLTVTSEHLRGSGCSVPNGLTAMLGVRYGEPFELPSELGPQKVYWSTMHTLGSIKRFCDALGLQPGDRAWVDVHEGQRFEVRRASGLTGATGLAGVAEYVGASPEGTEPELEARIAEALGLRADAPRRKVLARFRHRGANGVVDVLEGLWV